MRCVDLILGISTVACLSGCVKADQVPSLIDRWSFDRVGGTLFSNPESLTLKEIHLDTGTLVGREVIVEGLVADVSANGTFLVLKDDVARMLVVLTNLETAKPILDAEKPKALKVLGTVETGRKGLPFVRARAMTLLDEVTTPAPPTKT